jgi:hypothetical protein
MVCVFKGAITADAKSMQLMCSFNASGQYASKAITSTLAAAMLHDLGAA